MEANNVINTPQQLADRARRGDEAAVMELFDRYVDKVYRYVAYRVPLDDAKTLTTQIFEQMIRALPNYNRVDGTFEAYLYKFAADSVADYLLQRGWRQMATSELRLEAISFPDDNDLEKAEYKRLRKALSELSYIEQGIIILRLIEGYSYKEVAEILQITEDKVLEEQNRSLRHLAKLLYRSR